MAVINALPISASIEGIPNTKIDAPKPSAREALIAEQPKKQPTAERTTHIAAITNDSEKKILNTSKLLAPTALKIPISLFFCEIETEMKFEKRRTAKSAKPRPT